MNIYRRNDEYITLKDNYYHCDPSSKSGKAIIDLLKSLGLSKNQSGFEELESKIYTKEQDVKVKTSMDNIGKAMCFGKPYTVEEEDIQIIREGWEAKCVKPISKNINQKPISVYNPYYMEKVPTKYHKNNDAIEEDDCNYNEEPYIEETSQKGNKDNCYIEDGCLQMNDIECDLSSKACLFVIYLLLNEVFGLPTIIEHIDSFEEVTVDKLDKIEDNVKICKCTNFKILECVKGICEKLINKHFGLCALKKDLISILNKINDPNFGLFEIKYEVKKIEAGTEQGLKDNKCMNKKLDNLLKLPDIMTTGVVLKNSLVESVVCKVLNKSEEPQDITINVFDSNDTENSEPVFTDTITVEKDGYNCFIFGPGSEIPECYEVEYSGVFDKVFVWTGGRTNLPEDDFMDSIFIPECIIKNVEHLCV